MPVETSAAPHDLLKPVCWSLHNNPSKVEREYGLDLINLLDKFYDTFEKRPLLSLVKGHHSREKFWERRLAISDRLAAAIGRLKYRWNFWDTRSEEGLRGMFLLKVYDREENIKRPSLVGRQLLEKICDILRRDVSSEEVFKELNNLLSDYPTDSRFPLVSLKSHHWLTDSIRRSRALTKLCEENKIPSKFYLARVSILPVNFHRLKDLRAFREFAREAINNVSGLTELSQHLPLIVGDEVYFTAVDRSEIEEVLEALRRTQLPLRFRVHEWLVKMIKVGDEDNFLIMAVNSESYYTGEPELPKYYAGKAGRWAEELEEADNVLWVRVGLANTLENSAKFFLDQAEKMLEVLKVEDLPPDKRIEQKIDLSPDIMISIADGLDQFYDDCGRIIAGGSDIRDVTVLRSLEESVYLKGLEERSQALDIVNELVNLSRRVLVDLKLSFVLCDGKYPFWRVYELLKYKEEVLFIVRGEKLLKISTQDVSHIRRITQILERGGVNVSKSQFMEIVKEARRTDGPEPLKLLIDARFREGKLVRGGNAQAFVNNLKNMIDTLYKSHGNMDAVIEALDIISSFIRARREEEEEVEWL